MQLQYATFTGRCRCRAILTRTGARVELNLVLRNERSFDLLLLVDSRERMSHRSDLSERVVTRRYYTDGANRVRAFPGVDVVR